MNARRSRPRLLPAILLFIPFVAQACAGPGSPSRPRVVAAVYPLAWAAERIGGTDVTTVDLTPPGVEPHDLQLSVRARAELQQAGVILLIGKGFQPEVERVATASGGKAVDVLAGLPVRPSTEEGLEADPHVWLDPVLMRAIARTVTEALVKAAPAAEAKIETRAAALDRDLAALDDRFRTGLRTCALHELVSTHAAFAYLAARYGLSQIGLTGLTPEAEPSAAQIQRAREEARAGRIGAVFFEATDEGRRIGRSVATDVGVSALPLNTLESDPAPQNYLSQMNDNLADLRQGLRCT